MNIDDQTNELIEDYISGRLEQIKMKAFENRMASDKELHAAVQMERSMRAVYASEAKAQLKTRIKLLESAVEKNNQTTKIIPMQKRILPIISIAASLLLLLGAYMFFKSDQLSHPASQNDLFSSYIKKDMSYSNDALISFGTRGGGGDDEAAVKKAKSLKSIFQNLNDGNYLESRTLALDYLEIYPDDQEAQYVIATSHLYEGNYAQAIEWYAKLRQADSRDIRHEAEYYYGLCHVKVENGATEAKKVLTGVANDHTSEWQETAKHYLGDIE